jgi:hypothetical protein
MEKKYAYEAFRGHVNERVEYNKITDKTIWVWCAWQKKFIRRARYNSDGGYFLTFADAKASVISMARRNLAAAQRHVDYCRSKLQAAEQLKEKETPDED